MLHHYQLIVHNNRQLKGRIQLHNTTIFHCPSNKLHEQFYPDLESFGNRAEVYEDLEKKMLQFYNDLFLKFKINNRK